MFRQRARMRTLPTATMIRGDCLLRLRAIPDASIDSVITDLPYGINLQLRSNRARPLSIAGDGRAEARRLWEAFLPQAARVARPDTAHLFFGTWKSIWIAELLARHFTVKGCIVWYKNTWGYGWHLRPRWELIWLCHKGRPPLPARAEPDVWEHARDHRINHPCQKPVDLLRRCVRLAAPPGGHVLDPFAGIGSTGVAAVEEGRAFTGIEIDPRHARLATARIVQAQTETRAIGRAARDSSNAVRTPLNPAIYATRPPPRGPEGKSAPVPPARPAHARIEGKSHLRPRNKFRA